MGVSFMLQSLLTPKSLFELGYEPLCALRFHSARRSARFSSTHMSSMKLAINSLNGNCRRFRSLFSSLVLVTGLRLKTARGSYSFYRRDSIRSFVASADATTWLPIGNDQYVVASMGLRWGISSWCFYFSQRLRGPSLL